MSAPAHADHKKSPTFAELNLLYKALIVIGALWFIWHYTTTAYDIGKNSVKTAPAQVAAQPTPAPAVATPVVAAAATSPPAQAVAAKPVPAVDMSAPPMRFFHGLYSEECNAEEEYAKSVCELDIRGTPALAATKAGLYLCFDDFDGYWERWDPVSQQWFLWNPRTEFLIVPWARAMTNPGAHTPTKVSYWASTDHSCPAPKNNS